MSQLRLHQDIAGYQFEGPYLDVKRMPQEAGLYAIISHDGKQYYLLDVGFARNIMESCQENPRKKCWEHYKRGNIHFAFLRDSDLDEPRYRLIIKEIHERFKKIPCR